MDSRTREKTWFWSKEWQEHEQEVDAHVKAGWVKRARSAEELIRALKDLWYPTTWR